MIKMNFRLKSKIQKYRFKKDNKFLKKRFKFKRNN